MVFRMIGSCARQFCLGLQNEGGVRKSLRYWVKQERIQRARKTERQIDKTVEDSFPASDPPAYY
jgi:hypothetical protein